jgi:60 kDa SS-A/Ro ribonucleoprotein
MARASVSKFSVSPRSTTAPLTNREGYPAWERPIEEQVVQVLVCNTFGQSFYADSKTMIQETESVMDQMYQPYPWVGQAVWC